jgi:hypothetical protein
MGPGKSAQLTLSVSRLDGFSSPIELECLELPEGIVARKARSEPKGESARAVKLTLEARAGAKPFSGPFQVIGRAGALQRSARSPVAETGATIDRFWLTVAPAAKP